MLTVNSVPPQVSQVCSVVVLGMFETRGREGINLSVNETFIGRQSKEATRARRIGGLRPT